MRSFVMPESAPAQLCLRPFRSFPALSVPSLVLLVLLALGPVPRVQGQSSIVTSSSPVPDRIVDRVDNAILATIPGSTHPAIRNAIDNGRLPPATPLGDLVLVLTRSDAQQAALNSFNEAQNDPASPQYHQWLTPQQFGAVYGVSQDDLDAVSAWLQDQGFTIQEISPARTSIRFSGSSEQVETAFHTEMHTIQSNGVAHIANMSDIQIPAALTPVVDGVKALHNFFPKAQHHTGPMLSRNSSGKWTPVSGTSTLPALSQSGIQEADAANLNGLASAKPQYADNGYQLLVPYDMATIYNYKSLWSASTPINGAGQTIALAGTSNIVLSDVATFRAATGLPPNVPTVIITNSDPGTTALLDDRFENTLDVEWSGGAAPGASIVLVTSSQTSQTTDALYASEYYIINHTVIKIMSVSYGECELWMGTAGNQEYLNLWQQAYSQGIAVFVSSGDSAAAVCDDGNYNPATDYAAEYGTTVSGMTSTPYNVSVGGTDFNSGNSNWSGTNNGANMSNATGYIPEVPWNDTMTNQFVISSFNSQLGVNYNAEQWANWLLTNEGINGGNYDALIPPGGGSGGVSSCTTSSNYSPSSCGGGYPKPSWQAGVTGIVSSDKRTVPDVSFFASAGFMGVAYLICDTQPPGYSSPIPCSYPSDALSMAVGGTSVSSPVMAGVMALINQKAGSSQGNPNAVLYELAAKQTYSNCSAETATNSGACFFNDIDTGTIATPCFAGSVNCTAQTHGDILGILPGYAATVGYDKATGLGSLNVANVVNGWPSLIPPAPAVNVAPTSLTFATTGVGGSTVAQTITLTNSGAAILTISGITITGTNASAFSQTTTCGASLAASASCTVSVTFHPAAAGALTASLSFADNAAGSPQAYALSGTGVTAPAVSLSIASLSFASTNVGSSTAAQIVTLKNTGTAVLTLSSITFTGANATAFAQTNTCGTSMAVNASCSVSVTFRPNAAGALTASLSFADNATGSAQTVALSGTGVGFPTVSLSTASLAFNSINVGSYSVAQTVTLRNTGTAALTLSAITITGTNASAFSQTNTCGASLAAGASCAVSITFHPAAAGALTASLSFADNASNSAQTVALSGTGVGIPVVSLSPASLVFASTNVGSSTAVQAVTLHNTGTGALSLSGITLTGTNASAFTQTNTCGTSLAVTASCIISVTFKPAAPGVLTASLSFADNAVGSPQTVALSGTGIGVPVASLSPASLVFASTVTGYITATQTVTLKNTGTATLTLSSIAFTGTYASSFVQTNTCGASLAISASCAISVTFKPTAGGTLTASLSITDNASGSPQAVTLTGTGVLPAPVVSISVSTLSFPITVVSATNNVSYSPAQVITLTNTGNAPLAISSIALGGSSPRSFSQINNCPSSLAASASCTALLRFAPAVSGAQSATLIFSDNASNASSATQTVSLSGTGVAAPTMVLSSTTLSFGSVTHNTSSVAQSVTITNTSTTTPLNLTSFVLSGAGAASFAQVNNCGVTLATGSSCLVLVEFAPTATGAVTATLTVTANNPAATSSVTLSGTGQ